MLNEFRQAYPRGSLISELISIYQGKYLVRVLVIVDNVTLATGLAAEDTLEMAEDRARLRALGAISLDSPLPQPAVHPVVPSQSLSHQPSAAFSPSHSSAKNRRSISDRPLSPDLAPDLSQIESGSLPQAKPYHYENSEISESRQEWLAASQDYYKTPPNQNSTADSSPWTTPTKSFESFESDRDLTVGSGQKMPSPNRGEPPAISGLESSAYSVASIGETDSVIGEKTSSPINLLSDDERKTKIAQTTVEIQRLGWDTQQGREFLQARYNKRARSQLTDEELLDFLHYLQTQPDPT